MRIVREHVLAGRTFTSLEEMNAAFTAWLPIRRSQVHRTHGQVIAQRALADRAALKPLPALPYVVADHYLRRVGKDCLISFEASLYSVPAHRVRAGQRVQVRASAEAITIHALEADGGGVLAVHPRTARRGCWVVDPAHWDGLPDGHTRATTIDGPPGATRPARPGPGEQTEQINPLSALLAGNPAAAAPVTHRSLA